MSAGTSTFPHDGHLGMYDSPEEAAQTGEAIRQFYRENFAVCNVGLVWAGFFLIMIYVQAVVNGRQREALNLKGKASSAGTGERDKGEKGERDAATKGGESKGAATATGGATNGDASPASKGKKGKNKGASASGGASPAKSAAGGATAAASEFEAVRDGLREMVNVRDWAQYHTPRNLVLALVGEVGELAEIFQWKGDPI